MASSIVAAPPGRRAPGVIMLPSDEEADLYARRSRARTTLALGGLLLGGALLVALLASGGSGGDGAPGMLRVRRGGVAQRVADVGAVVPLEERLAIVEAALAGEDGDEEEDEDEGEDVEPAPSAPRTPAPSRRPTPAATPAATPSPAPPTPSPSPPPPPKARCECCVGTGEERVCWRRPTPGGPGRPYVMVWHTNEIGYRGVPSSVWDYAHYFETLACGVSHVSHFDPHDAIGAPRFDARFPGRVHYLNWPPGGRADGPIDAMLDAVKPDAMYTQQAGPAWGTPFAVLPPHKLLVHAVFEATQPHGTAYATVGYSVPRRDPSIPTIPLIAHLNASEAGAPDLRAELGIPKDALVFCRHGGAQTFDIAEARAAVCRYHRENPGAYFLMLGTNADPCESGLTNVIHLPATVDRYYKRRFLNSCNACVHGRSDGETFGLAVAECSLAGLPVMTHANTPPNGGNHLMILGQLALTYDSEEALLGRLRGFDAAGERAKAPAYAAIYKRFSPENVMLTLLRDFGILSEVIDVESGGQGRCAPADHAPPPPDPGRVRRLSSP